jgi:hypothetical protein
MFSAGPAICVTPAVISLPAAQARGGIPAGLGHVVYPGRPEWSFQV